MSELLKTECTLEGKLCNIFAIIMSLCDSDMKNRMERCMDYNEMDEDIDSLKLLATIKKIIYSGGTHDLNIHHNKVMVHMNLMNLYQDKFQDNQEFCDQHLAMQKVCDKLGQSFGQYTDDAKAMLKEQVNVTPTNAQVNKALNKIEDEHHVIIFLYKVDRTRYGKYVKQLENDMLKKKKDPFLKTVADVSQKLSGWQNVYVNNPGLTKANDGVTFTTTGTVDDYTKKNIKNNKKKHITCFKCK